MMGWHEQLESDGFVLILAVFSTEQVQAAIAEWSEIQERNRTNEAILAHENGPAYGARNLLQLWPNVVALARNPNLCEPICRVLGQRAGVVRALYFDKPPGHSWALPWHKDYNIAVLEHRDSGTFSKHTTKAAVPHAMAPFALLSEMLTARIHLDDATSQNGPLRIVPGSHQFYRLEEDQPREPVSILCRAGDVLLMRPLATHASGTPQPDAKCHRRIVHLEAAASPALPDGYRWHRFEPLRYGSVPHSTE